MAKDSDPVMITRRSAERVSGMLDWFDAFTENRRLRQAARHQRDDYPWLYEVTSVDAGSGTCTIQRRTSGDSADGREVPTISGVEYDADNEPNTGDIGEIARLGNGALFFFSRKAAAGYSETHVPSTQKTVTSTGDYTGDAVYWYWDYSGGSWSVEYDTFTVWEFDSPISVPSSTHNAIGWISGGGGLWNPYTRFAGSSSVTITSLSAQIQLVLIAESFDISTMDRATLEALSQESEIAWSASWGNFGDLTTDDCGIGSALKPCFIDNVAIADIYGMAILVDDDSLSYSGDTPSDGDWIVINGNEDPSNVSAHLSFVQSAS